MEQPLPAKAMDTPRSRPPQSPAIPARGSNEPGKKYFPLLPAGCAG